MNFPIIFYILGWVLNVEAALMLLPVLTGILYGESSVISFLITIALCLAIGIPLVILKPKDRVFYVREGFVTVALCWIVMSIMGALPFLFSGSITHPVDALFETVSGFTTTGASILSDVESLPRCILFWRSFNPLDRRNGSSCLSSFRPSPGRRLSHEPYESRESGANCEPSDSHGTVHSQNAV